MFAFEVLDFVRYGPECADERCEVEPQTAYKNPLNVNHG